MPDYYVVFTHRNGTSWDGKIPAHILDIIPKDVVLSDWDIKTKYEDIFKVPNLRYYINFETPRFFDTYYKNTGRRFE